MSNLFTDIEEIVPKLNGWCSVAKAKTLAAAVLALRPETTVEIGVLEGRSLIPMAMAHREIGKGIVIGVDPWDPAASGQGQLNPADAKFWSTLDHEPCYQRFMASLKTLKLTDWVQVQRKTSDTCQLPPVVDILHLDGNHGEQAFKDIQWMARAIRVGGLCYLDDLGWTGGAVSKAARWLLDNGWVELYLLDTGAMFQRIK